MAEPPNKKRKIVGNFDDRISELPDDMIVCILSRMSVKDAQRTSVLSRRWQSMWPFITSLDFDVQGRVIRFLQTGEPQLSENANWVSWVVDRHIESKIVRFRVALEVNGDTDRTRIDEWIRFAMRKGVEFLELDLSRSGGYPHYQFTDQVSGIREFPNFRALCLIYHGFNYLKHLALDSVDVNQNVVEYFIYNCPFLERVAMRHSDSLGSLKVVGVVPLKYLTIEHCSVLDSVEICDTNLVSLTYGGNLPILVLRNVLLLVELALTLDMIKWLKLIDLSSLFCALPNRRFSKAIT